MMIPSLSDQPRLLFSGYYAGERDVTWHKHDGAELVLVTKGKTELRVADVRLPGSPGMLWILPCGVPQYQANAGRVNTTYIGFQLAGYDDRPRCIVIGLDGHLRRWMDDLVDLHPTAPTESTSPLLTAFLAELQRLEHSQGRASCHPQAVYLTLSYLEQHIRTDISMEQLAEHVHLSPSHLNALFRKSVGCPPLQYQQRLRLRHAEHLLANPHLSIKEVAAACGYDDPNYFVRLFRKRYGRPPGLWRS